MNTLMNTVMNRRILMLNCSGSGGNHEHSHEQENINVKAAFIHVVGDFIQSLG